MLTLILSERRETLVEICFLIFTQKKEAMVLHFLGSQLSKNLLASADSLFSL
jgi:hypothetical protein